MFVEQNQHKKLILMKNEQTKDTFSLKTTHISFYFNMLMRFSVPSG